MFDHNHHQEPASEEFVRIAPSYDEDIIFHDRLSVPPAPADGFSFDRSTIKGNPPAPAGGTDLFRRENNGQSL
jgi:hypothetical protein